MNSSCPRCGCTEFYRLRTRAVRRCKQCAHDFTETSGTLLHSRKMPLEKYERAFEAFRRGATTAFVARLIDCNYRTAWRLRSIAKQALLKEIKDGHSKIAT